MYGKSVGTLKVFIKKNINSFDNIIVWEKEGSHGDQWNLAKINIPDNFRSNVNFQVTVLKLKLRLLKISIWK